MVPIAAGSQQHSALKKGISAFDRKTFAIRLFLRYHLHMDMRRPVHESDDPPTRSALLLAEGDLGVVMFSA